MRIISGGGSKWSACAHVLQKLFYSLNPRNSCSIEIGCTVNLSKHFSFSWSHRNWIISGLQRISIVIFRLLKV